MQAVAKPVFQRSTAAYERALSLDPNLTVAASQLITNRVERGELIRAYKDALDLVKRQPDKAAAHFAVAYVLRYAGLLDESARECDTALSLDPGNYTLRSCSWTFMSAGNMARAQDFLRLDTGSKWVDVQRRKDFSVGRQIERSAGSRRGVCPRTALTTCSLRPV